MGYAGVQAICESEALATKSYSHLGVLEDLVLLLSGGEGVTGIEVGEGGR